MSNTARSEKIDLRLTPQAKRLIVSAAEAENRTVSDFVLQSALARAGETLPDRRHFLLKDSIKRTLLAADIVGIRVFVVHAKDDSARAFYQRYGFIGGFSDPLHLCVLTKELKQIAAA